MDEAKMQISTQTYPARKKRKLKNEKKREKRM